MRNKARLKAEIRTKNGREAVEFAVNKSRSKKGIQDWEFFNELIGEVKVKQEVDEFQKTLPYKD